jgi:hypothetical protein
MPTEIEQVRAEFAAWAAAQNDEGISRVVRSSSATCGSSQPIRKTKRCASRRYETWGGGAPRSYSRCPRMLQMEDKLSLHPTPES